MTNEYVAKYLKLKGLEPNPDVDSLGDFVWTPKSEDVVENPLQLKVVIDLVDECGTEWVLITFEGGTEKGDVCLSTGHRQVWIKSRELSIAQLDSVLAFCRGLVEIQVPVFPKLPVD